MEMGGDDVDKPSEGLSAGERRHCEAMQFDQVFRARPHEARVNSYATLDHAVILPYAQVASI